MINQMGVSKAVNVWLLKCFTHYFFRPCKLKVSLSALQLVNIARIFRNSANGQPEPQSDVDPRLPRVLSVQVSGTLQECIDIIVHTYAVVKITYAFHSLGKGILLHQGCLMIDHII